MPSNEPADAGAPSRRRFLALAGASAAAAATAGCTGVRRRLRAPPVAWRTPLASVGHVNSPLVRVGDRVLAMGEHDLVAFAVDGERLWDSNGPFFNHAMTGSVIADGVAVVGDAFGENRAGYRPDGTTVWSVAGEEGFMPFAALDGLVVGGQNREGHGVLAVDAADGAVAWGTTPDNWVTDDGGRAATDVVAAGSVLVAADFDGPLAALNGDGTVRWTASDDWDTAGAGHPTLASSGSTAVAAGGAVAAFDAATGERRWRHVLPDYANGVAVADGTVSVAVGSDMPKVDSWDADAGVLAYNLAGGEPLWRTRLPAPEARSATTTPAAAGDRVFVGTADGTLAALDAATGERRWSRPVGSEVYTAPLVGDRRVFVGVERDRSAELVAVSR
ncbi:PQQ-binding-like beta-propeller repeat protein [Halobaculum sp. D14]|uniref:outer membrane protein assembly factor BamB family protein n=1 Tax=Halobaculum sp. D14 TaxID=3421642 RepID=UPI003EBCFEFD